MSADDYLALVDDGFRYELLHGVVLMSPSPSFGHQQIARRIVQQMGAFVDTHGLGEVVFESDVRLGPDVVYRPDVVYYGAAKLLTRDALGRPVEVPDVIVEVPSPSTRAMDVRTKRDDYERAGVKEYWIVGMKTATQFVFREGAYAEVVVSDDRLVSVVLPGFVLDIAAARRGVVGE